jgi:acyl carrier protein
MTEAQLRSYLKSRFRGYRDDISAEADLSGIVDSLGLFELVEFVEGSAKLKIPMADFQPVRFSSIRNIMALVDDLRARNGAMR